MNINANETKKKKKILYLCIIIAFWLTVPYVVLTILYEYFVYVIYVYSINCGNVHYNSMIIKLNMKFRLHKYCTYNSIVYVHSYIILFYIHEHFLVYFCKKISEISLLKYKSNEDKRAT